LIEELRWKLLDLHANNLKQLSVLTFIWILDA